MAKGRKITFEERLKIVRYCLDNGRNYKSTKQEEEMTNGEKLERRIQQIERDNERLRDSDLVIIDDLMYMAMDQREANLFFHLVNHLYERSSIILTSNKSPDQWGELIGDQRITTAILDRLLHRVEIIHSDDDSHRMRNRKSLFSAEV